MNPKICKGEKQAGLPVRQAGMTLVEVMVGITIIGILSLMAATAFPYVRQYQQATLTAQLIQSTMRRAQQLALDETRDEKCLALEGPEIEQQRHCSDVGIAIAGHDIQLFADTADDNRYTVNNDFILATLPFPSAVTVTNKAFLFEATPPSIVMFVDGNVRAASQAEPLTIQSGRAIVQLSISSYGLIQQSTPNP